MKDLENLDDNESEELRKTFYSQAYELVEDIQDAVLRIEADPEDDKAMKALQRCFHTLKGDSNSIGLTTLGTLCHRVEDVLTPLRDRTRHIGHDAIELLLHCTDTISSLLNAGESGENGCNTDEVIEMIDAFIITSDSDNKLQDTQDKSLQTGYTEYQELQIQDALRNGLSIYKIEILFHPMCGEKSVAAFMVTQRLNGMGQIIHSIPAVESPDIGKAERMTILFSANLSMEEIKKNTFITGITDEINIGEYTHSTSSGQAHPEKSSGFKVSSSADPPGAGQGSGLEDQGTGEASRLSESLSLNSNPQSPTPNPQSPNYKSEILRVEASKVDKIMNLVGELIIGRSMIEQIAIDIKNGLSTEEDTAAGLYAANSYMERTVSDLQRGITKMRMVPINHVFRKFPKIVRDISAERGKKVRLDIYGRETELDKGIVDALGEPLAHIIRNSIDHGIEDSAYRISIGKPEEGIITLRAYHRASQIVIEVTDDGRGIDSRRLKEKAVDKGFLNLEDAKRLSDSDAVNLIFLSGLTTSEAVSDVSGRGIGMDAVKTAVENMKGLIEVESSPAKGTLFRLELPLTLAIIKALLVEVSERLYAVPISAISEVSRIMTDDLLSVDGRDTLMLRDKAISVIHLNELFGLNGNGNKKKFALILGIGTRKVVLLVDRLIGQQELVIKAVDSSYTHSGLVAGASILGNGRVVLILDTPAIFKKAVEDEREKISAENSVKFSAEMQNAKCKMQN